MKSQDYDKLAGMLIEYSMELQKRDIIATSKKDIDTLLKNNEIRKHITALIEAIDDEY